MPAASHQRFQALQTRVQPPKPAGRCRPYSPAGKQPLSFQGADGDRVRARREDRVQYGAVWPVADPVPGHRIKPADEFGGSKFTMMLNRNKPFPGARITGGSAAKSGPRSCTKAWGIHRLNWPSFEFSFASKSQDIGANTIPLVAHQPIDMELAFSKLRGCRRM